MKQGPGHNRPPSDAAARKANIWDGLLARQREWVSRVHDLVMDADKAPEVVTDDNVGAVQDFIKSARFCIETGDKKLRTEEKAPYLEGGRTVDAWFALHVTPLGERVETMRRRLREYLVAKADRERLVREAMAAMDREPAKPAPLAELSRTRGDYGSVSSLREHWTFRNLDRATLDLEALRQWIPLECLETALGRAIRQGELRSIKGAEIYDDPRERVV